MRRPAGRRSRLSICCALLLQVLYSVRSEGMLMEQLEYNLLFRRFVGLGMDDVVWAPTTFTTNRDRLLDGDVARAFFEDNVARARGRGLLSAEHFTIDGTLLEAWPGRRVSNGRSVRHTARRSGQSDGQFPWGTAFESDAPVDDRSRQPVVQEGHGHEAKLAYLGEVLMENRHGLVVDACVVPATGTGQRDAAIGLVAGLPPRRVTVGGDKAYDTRSFIETMRQLEARRTSRVRRRAAPGRPTFVGPNQDE